MAEGLVLVLLGVVALLLVLTVLAVPVAVVWLLHRARAERTVVIVVEDDERSRRADGTAADGWSAATREGR